VTQSIHIKLAILNFSPKFGEYFQKACCIKLSIVSLIYLLSDSHYKSRSQIVFSIEFFNNFFFPFPPSPSVLFTENPSSSMEKQETNDHAPNLSCKRRRGEFEGEREQWRGRQRSSTPFAARPSSIGILILVYPARPRTLRRTMYFFPLAIRILI